MLFLKKFFFIKIMKNKLKAFENIIKIMNELRSKCPWDKKQTFKSLRNLTVEETFELSQAILDGDMKNIKEELGDLFLHIIFYSKIASELGEFDIADVINSLCKKLIYRHPHIYSDVKVENEEDVKKNWEELKLKGKKSVLEGVPKNLPALIKANRVQEKARAIGFDWEKREQVWAKVKEELKELEYEIENQNKKEMEEEFGDLFFSMINAARLYGIDPENALEKTNRKFIKRFNFLEKESNKKGVSLKEMSLEEMDIIWNKAKKL